MTNKSAPLGANADAYIRAVPYSGSLPQIVLYLSVDQDVCKCDKSLAGDTFGALADISRTSIHDFLHKGRDCGGNCELRQILNTCVARLESESIVEVELYDQFFDRLLRLRFLSLKNPEDGQNIATLHVIDITAGREVTNSLLHTNKQLGVLFHEKEYALTVSEEKNSQHRERLRDMDRLLKTLSTRLIIAQEQERNRISNDLHDGVGQHLSLARYSVGQACDKATGVELSETMTQILNRTLHHIDSSVQEVRRITRNLKPSMLEEFGIVATLELLIHEFECAHSDISIRANIQSVPSEPPADRSVAIMRILQEAINNISKHSGASQVVFDIDFRNHVATMKISDNGQGFDTAMRGTIDQSKTMYGLANMRDRARSTGGEIEINSAPGKGTTIDVRWS
jgi:signal transduction histidine kinase